SCWLSCLFEVAFPLVFGQSHCTKLTTDCAEGIDFKTPPSTSCGREGEITKRTSVLTSFMRFGQEILVAGTQAREKEIQCTIKIHLLRLFFSLSLHGDKFTKVDRQRHIYDGS